MNTIDKLIYSYRMLGYDKPVITFNNELGCYAMNICNPCGQWKLIKGNSEYGCIVGALKWAQSNKSKVKKEMYHYVTAYRRKIATSP